MYMRCDMGKIGFKLCDGVVFSGEDALKEIAVTIN